MANLINDNKMIWIIVVACVILFVAIQGPCEKFTLPEQYKIDLNRTCSSDCCSASNYPAPHDTVRDSRVTKKLASGELVGTNLMCDGPTGSGCVCATPDQIKYLTSRGGNDPAVCSN